MNEHGLSQVECVVQPSAYSIEMNQTVGHVQTDR